MYQLLLTLAFAAAMSFLTFAASFAETPQSTLVATAQVATHE